MTDRETLLREALEVCAGMLASQSAIDPRTSFKFTGDWTRLGTITISHALDMAEAALAAAQPTYHGKGPATAINQESGGGK